MKTVAILGAGFGGIRCALDLAKQGRGEVRVILIDRNTYHLFTPSLYEVASAYPVPKDNMFHVPLRRAVVVPYREIFAGTNIEVIQAEISSVNLKAHEIVMEDGQSVVFDYCVLALGSQANDFGIPGVTDYAYQFKTIDDALAINKQMHQLFNGLRDGLVIAPIKFLVIGAGFAGIELAAEIASYARRIAQKLKVDRKSFSVVLFEAMPTILPMISPVERQVIMNRLTDLRIVIMANSTIEKVQSDSVFLKNGQTVPGSMVVWTAGVQANKLLQSVYGLPMSPKNKVLVNQFLDVQGLDNVSALGDVIEFMDPATQKPIPGLAYTAKAQGAIVARNIIADMRGREKRIYRPNYEAWIAPVGAKFAAAHVSSSVRFKGFIGWLVRGVVDLRYLVSILPIFKAFRLFSKEFTMFTKND